MRIEPSDVLQDPHRVFCRSDHTIEVGSGSPNRLARRPARAARSTLAAPILRDTFLTIESTRRVSSALLSPAGTLTTMVPLVTLAWTVFLRRELRMISMGSGGAIFDMAQPYGSCVTGTATHHEAVSIQPRYGGSWKQPPGSNMPGGSDYPGPHEALERYRRIVEASSSDAEVKGARNPYPSRNGHMFSFLDRDGTMALRLSDELIAEYGEQYSTDPVIQYGSVMRGYVEIPDELFDDVEAAADWFDRSHQWIGTPEAE